MPSAPKSKGSKPSGRVFDVRRPGKAPASPTSRPVVVKHKASAQKAQVAVSGIGETSLMNAKKKINIQPQDDASKSVAGEQTTKKAPEPAAKSANTEALAATALTKTAEPPKTTPVEDAPLPPSAAAPQPDPTLEVDLSQLPDSSGVGMPPEPEPASVPTPELHDIVVSHHAQHSGEGVKVMLLLTVIVLLAFVALNILLDAEFLNWPLPHTDFL